MRIRVHELARELNVTPNSLLNELRARGEFVKSSSSTLEDPVVRDLRARYGKPNPATGDFEERDAGGQEIAEAPAPRRQSSVRGNGWRAGAVPRPNHPDLNANIERLAERFPAFQDHLSALRGLGSQVVYAGMSKQDNFTQCGVAHVRFSGAVESGFGFTREALFFYTPHRDLQARTFEAAVREMNQAKRSVTPDTFFMWAPDDKLRIKLGDWSEPSKLAIPLTVDPYDEMSFISLLREYVHSRDLFYVATPVKGASFFGRKVLLQSLRDDVLNQRVAGLFGLRKAGKTSILTQLRENLNGDQVVSVLVDLEAFPSPPEDPTDDVISDLRRRLMEELKTKGLRVQELARLPQRPTILEFKNALQALLKKLARDGHRVLLMLDEIEYLTPADKVDVAEGEMPRIAQMIAALRSLVQETTNFTFIVSGLTSAIVESGRLYGRPNPLFSWAKVTYVAPLTREEADDLARTVGHKMGIEIEEGALSALHEASGGHAFLYRSLASTVVATMPTDEIERVMTRRSVLAELGEWKSRVQGNIDEMMDHIRRYYASESVMLDLLIDDPGGFAELERDEHVAVRRLLDLGLIHKKNGSYEPNVILELV